MRARAKAVIAVVLLLDGVVISSARADEKNASTTPPNLEEIVLVFKTHFDIGYTDMAANVVQRYRTSMIDNALAVVDDSASEPEELKFVWTIPGWPMSKILEDWEGQTPERKQRVMEAFRQGRFVVHGLPFSTHTETLSEEDLVRGLRYSTELSRAAGLEPPRDAKMTDVPCHSWILPTLLAHAGIEFLHIGSNSGCSDPRVPLLFFREGPDGSRVLTMHINGYGTGLAPPPDWPYKTWLGLIHTGDNHGPPRPDEVRRLIKEAKVKFPGVNVRIGRLSDFADAILAKEDVAKIPVVRGDTPDTWIHGPMCDPQGRIAARHVQAALPAAESLATMLDAWGLGAEGAATAAPRIAEAYDQSLLYGEHTWGASLGWIGLRLDYGDGWQQRLDERHRRMVASWEEHSAYAYRAQAITDSLLEDELTRLSQSIDSNRKRAAVYNPLPWARDGLAMVDGEPRFVRDVPPMGYRTIFFDGSEQPGGTKALSADQRNGQGVLENDFFRVTYDRQAGRVTSLVDKKNKRDLVRADSDGLGHFLYERFSAQQCDRFVHDYNTSFPKWITTQFSKPELPPDVSYRAQSPATATRIEEIHNGDRRGVRFTFGDDPSLPYAGLELEFRLYDAMPVIDITLSIDGKRADTWPEAGWLCLPLAIEHPQFRLGRLGGIVDPARDIIPGANRHLLWLYHGMAVFGEDGYGVGICPIDAPAVSLGEPGCWRFSWDYVPKKADVFVNLFNNQWTTNFRLWNEGSWRQRVRIWTFKQYDAQESLIQPALEARQPMLARVAHVRSDRIHAVQGRSDVSTKTLPERATGLTLSRRGVAVTSFGVDPDTKKRMLRLWEQAGKDGPCTVTLPEGLAVRRVQPCDLRGRPTGQPLPVKAGRFNIEIGHYAPLNLELMSD